MRQDLLGCLILTIDHAHSCHHLAIPIVCLTYVNIELNKFMSSSRAQDFMIIHTIAIVYIHRAIWQKACFSAMVLVISHVIQILEIDCWLLRTPSLWLTVSFVTTTSVNFIDKLYLVILLMFTSVAMKKQRFPMILCLICKYLQQKCLFGYNIVLILKQLGFDILIFPFILSMVLMSSILSVPMLPLFTLPLYFLSFGRPSHFWPNIVSLIEHDHD